MQIIKHYGIPTEALLPNGKRVHRMEKLRVVEAGRKPRMVQCAPYDNHFIYATDEPNMSQYMCTCGSIAVIVGYNVYKEDASPTPSGELFICHLHGMTGFHNTGE